MSKQYNVTRGLSCLILFFVAATSARAGGNAPDKPTHAELEAKLLEAQKLVTAADFEKFMAGLKGMGPAPRLQKMLADRYLMSQPSERVMLLHLLHGVGVDHAVTALPLIAADFAKFRPKHPNDMSFAGFYVLEDFMHLAWKKLPAQKNKDEKKLPDPKIKPKPLPVDEQQITKVASDGFTHTGSQADRKAIRLVILEQGLHVWKEKNKLYTVPPAEDSDWVRVLGNHAFVRLRGQYSGVDFIFIKSKTGQWSHLADLGHWVN